MVSCRALNAHSTVLVGNVLTRFTVFLNVLRLVSDDGSTRVVNPSVASIQAISRVTAYRLHVVTISFVIGSHIDGNFLTFRIQHRKVELNISMSILMGIPLRIKAGVLTRVNQSEAPSHNVVLELRKVFMAA